MRARNQPRGMVAQAFIRFLFEPAHFVMERKMLLTVKRLAEGGASRP